MKTERLAAFALVALAAVLIAVLGRHEPRESGEAESPLSSAKPVEPVPLAPAAAPPALARVESARTLPAPSSAAGAGAPLVRGRLVFADGRPSPQTLVELVPHGGGPLGEALGSALERDARGTPPSCRSAPDGAFELRAPEELERAALLVDRGGPLAELVPIERDLCPDATVDLGDVVVGGERPWTGRVVDESGRPVEGARVHVLELPLWVRDFGLQELRPDSLLAVHDGEVRAVVPLPALLADSLREPAVPTAVTDPEGRFAVGGPGRGSADVVLRLDGRPTGLAGPFDAPEDGARELELGDLVLASGRELRGTVRDHRGRALSGARVAGGTLSPRGGLSVLQPGPRTDADGRFRLTGLAAGGAELLAVLPEGALHWQLLGPFAGSDDLVLSLAEPHAVAVLVRDEGGRALRTAEVRLSPRAPRTDLAVLDECARQAPWPERSLPGDAEGRHAATDVPAGAYALEVRAPGYAPRTLALEVEGELETVVALVPAAALELVVTDCDSGAPVPGALIAVHDGEEQTSGARAPSRTDAGGRARIEPLPASEEIRLRVSAPRHAPATVVLGSGTWQDGEVQGVCLERGGILHARLRRAGDEAPPPLEIAVRLEAGPQSVEPEDAQPRWYVTDAAGEFVTRPLAAGTYSYRVFEPAGARELALERSSSDRIPLASGAVELGNGRTTRLELEVPARPAAGAGLRGVVRIDGRPAPGVTLDAQGPGGRRRCVSDGQGRYSIDGLSPGSVFLAAYRHEEGGSAPLRTLALELAPGEQRVVDVEVRDLSLHIEVRARATGAPVAGAAAYLWDDTWFSAERRTDSAGRARLSVPRSGSFHLDVAHPALAPRELEVAVEGAGSGAPVLVELDGLVRFAGTIVLEGNVPVGVRSWALELRRKDIEDPLTARRTIELSDAKEFSVRDLSAGAFKATLQADGLPSEPTAFVLGPDGDESAVLRFRFP